MGRDPPPPPPHSPPPPQHGCPVTPVMSASATISIIEQHFRLINANVLMHTSVTFDQLEGVC